MPKDYQIKQYPLCTSTIDKRLISGNIAVINDVYINQLKMTHAELAERVIPSFNDQAMNAHIHGAKALQMKDVNPFTQLQNLQLRFDLFHLCMNLIWALLHVHWGSIHQVGSLPYFFALLDHTRLECDHPDYHTLLATLLQILRGIILNAWKVKCRHTSLAAFASSNPSPDELLQIANQIILDYTTAPCKPTLKQAAKKTVDDLNAGFNTDNVHYNICLLTHDLLYVLELVHATLAGDFSRIEDILGNLALIFHGAGSNNYCSKILHFLYNLKKVWTPEFI